MQLKPGRQAEELNSAAADDEETEDTRSEELPSGSGLGIVGFPVVQLNYDPVEKKTRKIKLARVLEQIKINHLFQVLRM